MDPFYKVTIQKHLPQWRGGAMFGQYNLRAAYSTMADILYESSDLFQWLAHASYVRVAFEDV